MITKEQYFVLIIMYGKSKEIKQDFTASEMARLLNISYGSKNPTFGKVQNLCIENGIWKLEMIRGNHRYYVLDIKKLADFIRDTEIFNRTGEFIKLNKPFDYNF